MSSVASLSPGQPSIALTHVLSHGASSNSAPRWLQRWAILTAVLTFGLLTLGAVVTTFQVGMADPIWPTYPWHLLLVSWQEPKPGFLIEHSHRLAGYVVGTCVIVLAAGLWFAQRARTLQWLGIVALGGVIVQGLLGGFRVRLNEWLGPNLALIHGSFAPVVFSLLVGLAWLTIASPNPAAAANAGEVPSLLRKLAPAMTCLILVQIVMGGIVRHTYSPLGQRGHLLLAFAVFGCAVWLAATVYSTMPRAAALTVTTTLILALIGLQLVLGVESWMLKYFAASSPAGQAIIRTAHVLTGSLILAASFVVTLQAYAASSVDKSIRGLEGVT